MKAIILAINPEFVSKIFSGEKCYEYRKRLSTKDINKIYIYETAPVKRIVGEVTVKKKILCEKEKLWEMTKNSSGITKVHFDSYFNSQDFAGAYFLGSVTRYEVPKPLEDFGLNYAPQSFVYIED